MTSITVGTGDLRAALTAVAPHADPDADFPPLHRIRFDIDPENLSLSATNRYTAGHAIVSIEDHGDGELAPFDLSPTDVKEILALFRGRGGKNDDEMPDDRLRIDIDTEHVRVTDVAGLFDGKSLSLPRYPHETNFPRIPELLRATLTKPVKGTQRLVTHGKLLRLFTSAASAYGQPLVIEPTGANAALVVSCGESFLGLLMPLRQEPEDTARQNEWREAWLRRLPASTDVTALLRNGAGVYASSSSS